MKSLIYILLISCGYCALVILADDNIRELPDGTVSSGDELQQLKTMVASLQKTLAATNSKLAEQSLKINFLESEGI